MVEPDNVAAHLPLGIIYGLRGKVGEARGEFRRVLELEPQNDEAQAHLAREEGEALARVLGDRINLGGVGASAYRRKIYDGLFSRYFGVEMGEAERVSSQVLGYGSVALVLGIAKVTGKSVDEILAAGAKDLVSLGRDLGVDFDNFNIIFKWLADVVESEK